MNECIGRLFDCISACLASASAVQPYPIPLLPQSAAGQHWLLVQGHLTSTGTLFKHLTTNIYLVDK